MLPIMHITAAQNKQETQPVPPPPPPPNLEGHYQVQDAYGVSLSLSALYWKPYEEGLDFVIQNQGSTGLVNNASVRRAPFNWHWGWRAGLGYQIPQKKMNVEASWTHYTSKGSSSPSVDLPLTLFSVWSLPTGGAIPPVNFEQQATAHSRLFLNVVDLGLSGVFAPRPFLDITPYIGLSTAWIHQKFNFNLAGGPGLNGHTTLDDKIRMKNDFWGIGPKIGMDTLWDLGYGFGICGNFNLSLLYGFFKLKQQETAEFSGLEPPTTFLDLTHNLFHIARLNFDTLIGLRWDKMFQDGRYHLTVEAGWENLIFLGQNQLMRFPSQINQGINSSGKGDLTIQGGSGRVAFTF